MSLNDLKNEIYKCAGCNYCREMYTSFRDVYLVCPVREKLKFVSYTGRGRLMMARGVMEKALDYTPEFIDHLYTCLQCGMCTTHCPAEIDKDPVVHEMRKEIVERKLRLPDGVTGMISNMKKGANIFGLKKENRSDWAKGLNLPDAAPTVYFAGCLASYKFPKIARSAAAVMKAANGDFTTLGSNEWCCGNRAFQAGNVKMARGMAEHNAKALEKMGAKEVVLSCAEGYHHFKKNYPALLNRELTFRVTHLAEYIDKAIQEKRLSLGSEIRPENVVYVDPCALGRKEGLYEEPRRVIDALPGVTRLEMKRNRGAAWCCGAGEGIVRAARPDLSAAIAQDTIDDLPAADGMAIVTTCPTCHWTFEEAIAKNGTSTRVYDLAELAAKSLYI